MIQIEAAPGADSPAFGEAGGAYVNCWVLADSMRDAEIEAIRFVTDSGWVFDSIHGRESFEGQESPESKEGQEYLDQARIDGIVCVFHTWPPDEPDEPTQ
jgi:hypothetical protein